jgi:prevent-host-death family protein
MAISLTEDFKTAEELTNQTEAILEQVQKNGRPVVITHGGKPAAVLLDVAKYEWMVHLLNLSRLLNEGMEDVRAGRVRPAEEVFKELDLGKKKKVSR